LRRGTRGPGNSTSSGTRPRRGPCRFGGAARHGVRYAAAEHGADAEQSSAGRNQYRPVLGAAGPGRVLVRSQTAGLVLRARQAAPLAIVISGTGSDGNTAKLSTLRGALYGAGYHVLTMPSPTFPGFIVSTSSTGVAGDLTQDGHDLYAAMQQIVAHLPRKVQITEIDVLGYSLGGANAAVVNRSIRRKASSKSIARS